MNDTTYDVMVNTSTGNSFQVIADDRVSKFRGGFRLWLGDKKVKGKDPAKKEKVKTGVIYFRFRLEPIGSDGPNYKMGDVLKAAYPLVVWTGGSLEHGSLAGGISTGKNPYDGEGIIQRVDEYNLGGNLYDAFKHLFPTMNFYHDRAGFQAYFLELVKGLFGKIEGPDYEMGAKLEISGMVKEITAIEVQIKELVGAVAAKIAEVEPIDL